MDNQLYSAIIELFPSDVIPIILLYSETNLITQMQNYFPRLLKDINPLRGSLCEASKACLNLYEQLQFF